jgi:predicted dehydrogenase
LNGLEGAELVRVADLHAGRREFIQKRFPCVQTTGEIGDIISDPSIDAVFIATPPETHHAIAMQVLKAGKHVFVEKPLTTRASDAEQLVALACQLGRKLAVGHLFLYHPAIVLMRELLDKGVLGNVYFISSTRANLGPPNARIDVLWDLAPHDISIILRLMDESPVEVVARGAWFTKPGFVETAYINMAFASGRMAQVNVSWLSPNKTRLLHMACSAKSIVYDDMQPVQKVQIFDAGEDNRIDGSDKSSIALAYGSGNIWSPPLRNLEPLGVECEDFIRSIATDNTPVSDGRRALDVVRVLEAASESIRRPAGRTAVAVGARS